ncbi:MAG TPA: GNAT family N-acetyltransferase [Acidobacteriaceae bacterium]|jgi:ribosomal protein S18 acetylase RimI-like enzyme
MSLNQEIVLRGCVAGDEEALALVGAATFLETFAGLLTGQDILAHCRVQHAASQYAGWLADARYRQCLAEFRSAPVGFAVLSPPDLPVAVTGDDIELKRIYLLHRFQGGGLGRRLLEWSVAQARSLGKRRLLLGVKADNTAALAFYDRVGFVRIGERKFLVGTMLCDDYILSLTL